MDWTYDIGKVRSIQMEYIRHVRSFYGATMDRFKASGASIEDFANEWMRSTLDVNDLVTRYKGYYLPQGISRALEFPSRESRILDSKFAKFVTRT